MSARASILPAALWGVLPKCPLCLAAYSSVLSASDLMRLEPVYDEVQYGLLALVVALGLRGVVRHWRQPRGWLAAVGIAVVVTGKLVVESDLAAWAGVLILLGAARHGWLFKANKPCHPRRQPAPARRGRPSRARLALAEQALEDPGKRTP